ncbi:hypothetical protein K438DRAFT_2149407 [Mycena galopus ATCC 62051]|nr:hypothetical protein K438DRAFT_2149407 [Mycena galopus ATCC 62051]
MYPPRINRKRRFPQQAPRRCLQKALSSSEIRGCVRKRAGELDGGGWVSRASRALGVAAARDQPSPTHDVAAGEHKYAVLLTSRGTTPRSPSILCGAGTTHGETVEQNWEFTNRAAASTKMMGIGTRHATLEDLFGFHNWRRTVAWRQIFTRRMATNVKEGQTHRDAFEAFNEVLTAQAPELVTKWVWAVHDWEARQHKDGTESPFELKEEQGMTIREIRLKLEKEELLRNGSGEEIEPIDVKALQNPTERQSLDFVKRRTALTKRLHNFRKLQWTYMPNLRWHLTAVQRVLWDAEADRDVETVRLFMLSDIQDTVERDKACAAGLSDIEAELRVREAREALHALRHGLHARTLTNWFRLRNCRGQRMLTRGLGVLRQINLKVHKAKLRYRYARNALLREAMWECYEDDYIFLSMVTMIPFQSMRGASPEVEQKLNAHLSTRDDLSFLSSPHATGFPDFSSSSSYSGHPGNVLGSYGGDSSSVEVLSRKAETRSEQMHCMKEDIRSTCSWASPSSDSGGDDDDDAATGSKRKGSVRSKAPKRPRVLTDPATNPSLLHLSTTHDDPPADPPQEPLAPEQPGTTQLHGTPPSGLDSGPPGSPACMLPAVDEPDDLFVVVPPPLLLPSPPPFSTPAAATTAVPPSTEPAVSVASKSTKASKAPAHTCGSRYLTAHPNYPPKSHSVGDHIFSRCISFNPVDFSLGVRGHGTWERELQVLDNSDVRALNERALTTEEAEQQKVIHDYDNVTEEGGVAAFGVVALGESRCTLSWIWYTAKSLNPEEPTEIELVEALRVEWCKAYARMHRWEEDVVLVEEEMRCTIQYGRWSAQQWATRAGARTANVEPELVEGLTAYAQEHVDCEVTTSLELSAKWARVRERGRAYLARESAPGVEVVVNLDDEDGVREEEDEEEGAPDYEDEEDVFE